VINSIYLNSFKAFLRASMSPILEAVETCCVTALFFLSYVCCAVSAALLADPAALAAPTVAVAAPAVAAAASAAFFLVASNAIRAASRSFCNVSSDLPPPRRSLFVARWWDLRCFSFSDFYTRVFSIRI